MNGYTLEGSIDDVGEVDPEDIRDIARDKLIYATGLLQSREAEAGPGCPHGHQGGMRPTRSSKFVSTRVHSKTFETRMHLLTMSV